MTPEGYAVELSGGMFTLYYYQDMNQESFRTWLATSYNMDDLYRVMMQHKASFGREATIWIG